MKDGREVKFKPIQGDTERAIEEWKRVRGEVIKVTRTSLREDFVFKKISEMIESEVRGKRLDEEDKVQSEIRLDSQMALWIAFLNRYAISNFKFFVYILLILPANTAGLERMFKSLKAMKSKIRNRMSKAITKKLIMILNFCEDIEFDLVQVAEKFKTLMS